MRHIIISISLILCSLLNAQEETGFKLMHNRLRKAALGIQTGNFAPMVEYHFQQPIPAVGEMVTMQKTDGSWPFINYLSKEKGGWDVYKHFDYLLILSREAMLKNENAKLLKTIHQALNYWIEKDFVSPNWWHNKIYMPMVAGDLLLILEGELTKQEHSFLLDDVMAKSIIDYTGQNRMWVCGNVLTRAIIKRDSGLIRKAVEAIMDVIEVTTDEGLQPDWSFQQHGKQMQLGNYGMSYANSAAKWLWVTKGTPYENPEKVRLIRNFLLQCQQWVTWKDVYDISGLGRQIWPNSMRLKSEMFARGAFSFMKAVDSKNTDIYENFHKGVYQSGKQKVLKGNKVYWRSDYMVHRDKNFMATSKMCSDHLMGTESINKENLLGAYLSDGTCFLYQSGREYLDIFPLWNWNKLPGITTVGTDERPPRIGVKNISNRNTFVGGVSDNNSGCVAMNYERNELKAKKAWFASGNILVALGAGISYNGEKQVSTSVNQCFFEKEVSTFKDGKQAKHISEVEKIDGFKKITHDGFTYYFPHSQKVKLQVEERTGTWDKIIKRIQQPVVMDTIFDLQILHGSKPQNAQYVYFVSETKGKHFNAPRIVQNSPEVQAVQFKNKTMMVFYKAAELELTKQIKISVNIPCIVMLNKNIIHISEPTRQHKNISLKLAGKRGISLTKTIDLPQGVMAGSAVTFDVSTR